MYVGLQVDYVSRETLTKLQSCVSDLMSTECIIFNYKCERCRNRTECDALELFIMQIDDVLSKRSGEEDLWS